MVPRSPLTSKGILFLTGNTKYSQPQEQCTTPREKNLWRPQSFSSRGSCNFQTEGGDCLGTHFLSRCTCRHLLGGPTWDLKTHRAPTLNYIMELKFDRQPGQKMGF